MSAVDDIKKMGIEKVREEIRTRREERAYREQLFRVIEKVEFRE